MRAARYLVATSGPLRLFAIVRSFKFVSARARRRARPGRGSDGLPFASLRVPCGTRSSGPSHNSLRSLRSLRSNTCAESDDEARQMRARPEGLRSSAAPIRPAQAPPGALPATEVVSDTTHTTPLSATRHPGRAQRACEALRSTGLVARARSALRALTRRVCSSAVSAANVASYAAGPPSTGSGRSVPSTSSGARAPQGSRSEAKTASPARWALPGCPVAAPLPTQRNFNNRKGPKRLAHSAMDH